MKDAISLPQPNPQPREAAHGERAFTGWHMLAIMVAFFGVIIAVNVTMAVLAGRTWTGLVVKNSYVASQSFNRDLQTAAAQHARGWQSRLAYRDGVVSLELKDRKGAPVALGDLTLHLGRPAFEQADRDLVLAHRGDGRYSARIALDPGIWSLRIESGKGATSYRRDSRLLVKAGGRAGAEYD